jgi:hypothetical protein
VAAERRSKHEVTSLAASEQFDAVDSEIMKAVA